VCIHVKVVTLGDDKGTPLGPCQSDGGPDAATSNCVDSGAAAASTDTTGDASSAVAKKQRPKHADVYTEVLPPSSSSSSSCCCCWWCWCCCTRFEDGITQRFIALRTAKETALSSISILPPYDFSLLPIHARTSSSTPDCSPHLCTLHCNVS